MPKSVWDWVGLVGAVASVLGLFVGLYALLAGPFDLQLTPLTFFWKCLWTIIFVVAAVVVPIGLHKPDVLGF